MSAGAKAAIRGWKSDGACGLMRISYCSHFLRPVESFHIASKPEPFASVVVTRRFIYIPT